MEDDISGLFEFATSGLVGVELKFRQDVVEGSNLRRIAPSLGSWLAAV